MIDAVASDYQDSIRFIAVAGRSDLDPTAARAEEYLKLNPAATEERFYLALAYQQAGRNDDALIELDKFLSDDEAANTMPQARHVRGVILAERGQFAEAAEEWGRFLAVVPESGPSDDVRRQINEWKTLGVIP